MAASALGLVGREREQAVLAAALTRFDEGVPVRLAITGEIGIGKTRLLEELGRVADAQRIVLAGRAVQSEREQPLALFVDALAAQSPRLADGVAERRLTAAIRSVLRDLAARSPIVLLLDDVQWADRASLRLIGALAGARSEPPLMIVLAYRPRRFPAALQTAFSSFVVLRPRRLRRHEADRLLPGVDPATRQALHRASVGNPFFLQELARAGRSSTALPATITAAVGEELADLGRAARTLVRVAAVVGVHADDALVEAVSDLSPEECAAAVEALRARGLIHPSTARASIAFSHPLLERAVHESSGPGWQIRAHRRAAAFLAERPGSVVARARHLACSAAPGDTEAVDVLRQAARDAPDGARRWLEAAVGLVPDDDRARRVDLLRELASAHRQAGSASGSRDCLLQAAALLPSEPADAEHANLRGAVVADLARLEHDQLEWGDPRPALGRALRDLDGLPSVIATALELELAVDHWLSGELDCATGHASRAADLAGSLGDGILHAEAELLQLAGDPAAASVRSLHVVARALGSLGDLELAGRVRATVFLGHAARAAERTEAGRAALLRGLGVSAPDCPWRALMHVCLGEIDVFHGRLADADAAAASALEEAGSGESIVSASAWTLRSWVRRLSGDTAGAISAAERAGKLAARASAAIAAGARCQLGAALIESGASDDGMDALLNAAGGPELGLVVPAGRASWYEILAAADLQAARRDEAELWVDRCERSAQEFDPSTRTAIALRARATLLLARDDFEGAARHARDAAAHFDGAGARLDAARCRAVLGQALERGGDPDAAAEALRRAHRAFAAAGALRHRDHAARELRRLGHRIAYSNGTPRVGSGISSLLSAREHQVAQLAAAGRTNRAIATELFLSERTVETYLSRAFAKLDVSSRVALARVLDDRTVAGS